MTYRHTHTSSGQVMIISLLVLGFVTLGFILIGITSMDEEAQTNLVLQNKALSATAASGCMEQAMERLGLSASYAGNETLTVASSTCMVRPVVVGSSNWTLETWSQVSDQYTRYRAVISTRTPMTISSWTEVAGF